MPEIVEYHKLRLQLQSAWTGCRIIHITAPPQSPNPKKYFQGDFTKFREALVHSRIHNIGRHGKMLFVTLGPAAEFGYAYTWQIHLSSTGWFMPHNDVAKARAAIDPIYQNFLHKINDRNVRVRFHFDNGQIWNYHDGRTWGKWWLQPPTLEWRRDNGPDWLKEAPKALVALRDHHSRRPAKDVLCDQHVTAGLGNYLACETLYLAKIHPHSKWHRVTDTERTLLGHVITNFLVECIEQPDHKHWNVFNKARKPCPRHPKSTIAYAKDGTNGKRGSYFCLECQEKKI